MALLMNTFSGSNNDIYPESLSCDMDIKDLFESGNKCDFLAFVRNCGGFNSAVWVPFIILPSGNITRIPSFVAHLFIQGKLICKK